MISKAFDSIDHSLLLVKQDAYGVKQDAYGVRESELRWFVDYLSNREQRVVLNSVSPEWFTVTRGVPQGSILGPLLFILFVNDLPKVVKHCTVNMYADDTAIYTANHDPGIVSSHLQEIYNKLSCGLSRID